MAPASVLKTCLKMLNVHILCSLKLSFCLMLVNLDEMVSLQKICQELSYKCQFEADQSGTRLDYQIVYRHNLTGCT